MQTAVHCRYGNFFHEDLYTSQTGGTPMKPISLETALQILDLLDPIALFDENGKYIYVNKPWIEPSRKR